MFRRLIAVGSFLFLFTAILPVHAQFGMTKTTVRLELEHAPAVRMPGTRVEIVVEPQEESAEGVLTPIRRYFESQFVDAGFAIADGRGDQGVQPDFRMHVLVSPFTQRIDFQREVETHQLPGKYGCDEGQVTVTRVRVRNKSSFTVAIEVAGSGERIFETTEPVSDHVDVHVDGPELCKGHSYGERSDLAGLKSLSDHFVALAGDRAAADLFGWTQRINVMIAKPNPLKPGNKFALVGEWDDALEMWQAAALKNPKTEAYRFYNVGVANEALAYANLADLAKAREYLELADAAYKEAMKLQPKEKFFRPAFGRIRAAEKVIEAWTEYRYGSQSAARRR